MLEFVILIGGFVLCAAVSYIGIDRMFRMLEPETEGSDPLYCVITEDLVFLDEIKSILSPRRYHCYTGMHAEVLAELANRRADLVILNEPADNIPAGLQSRAFRYYRSSLTFETNDISAQFLNQNPKGIVLCYRSHMKEVIEQMIDSGIIF